MPEFRLVEDFVTSEEEAEIIHRIKELGQSTKSRTEKERKTLLRFGRFKPTLVDVVPEIPSFLSDLAEKITTSGFLVAKPDVVQLNEYLPGQGIDPHIDSRNNGEIITILSLGSHTTLIFTHKSSEMPLLLKPRSLFQMWGDLRYEWKHHIEAKKFDLVEGVKQARSVRHSLVFRHSDW